MHTSPRSFSLPVLKRFPHCEQGATAIEYALIAALIAVVIIGAVTGLGQSTASMYESTANAISQ